MRWASDAAALRSAASPGASAGRSAPALGAYDVVALRVEFQPDTTRFTTGNGTFAGPLFADGLAAAVDPLPHDAGYFEAHLAFLRNWVATVSEGRAWVRTHLLPGVVTVSGRMGDYSPTGPDADADAELTKLARLSREAWSLADGSTIAGLGIDPARTAFVLFHAGVGRDIELLGTTLDKTPEDLPSLYFSPTALDRLVPSSDPVVGGLPVTNTLVIPRTESRQGLNFITDQSFLVELSINGLLAASFLNYLGVPDLFDTATGESAVGPFDVMDGLGIFAMNGLFPPQPSAWTRSYLGWADVVEATPTADGVTYALPHADGPDPASVLKVPVSAAEYFLVENRHREPGGVRMSVWRDGAVTELAFPNDSETFNPYTIEGFEGGVVLSAAPYDFALPGGEDENGNPLLGGALVWHVDERRLAETLATNSVNADKDRRAIDLEEADGAQDIGYPSGGFFGPSFENGTPFDFWFEGNPVSVRSSSGEILRLYENRFGPDTVPASQANDGGASFVEIGGFSAQGTTMTASVRLAGTEGMSLAWTRPWTAALPGPGFSEGGVIRPFRAPSGDGHLFFGRESDMGGRGVVYRGDSGAPVALVDDVHGAEPALDADGHAWFVGRERIFSIQPTGELTPYGPVPPAEQFGRTTTQTVIVPADGLDLRVGVIGDAGPRILRAHDGTVTLMAEAEMVKALAVTDAGELLVVGMTAARVDGTDLRWTYAALEPDGVYRPQFGRDRLGVFGVLASSSAVRLLQPDGAVVELGSDGGFPELDGAPSAAASRLQGLSPHAAVADLDGDGLLEALVTSATDLWAFHRTGSVVSGFPIPIGAPPGSGAPVVSRMSDSGGLTVLIGLEDGTLDAFDLGYGSRRVPGFPLPVGTGPVTAPLVEPDRVTAMDRNGHLRSWTLARAAEPAMALVSAGNSSFVTIDSAGSPDPVPTLFDPVETYNWPNPVNGGTTWIRFAVTEPSDVTVTIVDLAGRRVALMDHPGAPARIPTEIGWTADVPSGVYIARVHARSASGRTEDRLVKIAVMR